MVVRNLSEYIYRGGPSICEACGAAFTCGAGLGDCWCAEVKLGEAARAALRERYERCLCRACLEGFVGPKEVAEEFNVRM